MKTIFSVITIVLALAPAADAARGGSRGTKEQKGLEKEKDKKKCKGKGIPNNW
jgi:hypothetical protein